MPKRRTIKRKVLAKVCAELRASESVVCQQLRHVMNTMERLSAASKMGIVDNARLISATGFGDVRAGHLIYALHMSGHIQWRPKIAKNREEGWVLK